MYFYDLSNVCGLIIQVYKSPIVHYENFKNPFCSECNYLKTSNQVLNSAHSREKQKTLYHLLQ